MERIVRTSPFPVFPVQVEEGTEIIAFRTTIPPESRGRPNSLSAIAAQVLLRNGFGIASRTHARHVLEKSIYKVAPGSDVSSIASRIGGSLKIVLRTGMDINALITDGSPKVSLLARIATAYQDSLRRAMLVDSCEMLLAASRLITHRRKVIVFGHFRARTEELQLIDALADDGSVYFLPCGTDRMFNVNKIGVQELEKRGWTVDCEDAGATEGTGRLAAARFAGISGRPVNVSAEAFPSINDEVRSTLARVKRLLREGTSPGDIAIVARDMKLYARPVGVTADEYALPIEIDHLIPLENTGFGGFVAILIEAIERDFAFEPTARLAMHPFGPGLGERRIAEARRKRITGIAQWLDFCPLLERLCDKTEKQLQSWIDEIRSATETLGTRTRAVGITSEWWAYQKFFETLETVSLLEGGRSLSFEGFAAVASEILKEERVPMRPRVGGVKLLKPEDVVGSSYSHVFVMGLAEGIFPKPPMEDPLIDFHERRRLGVDRGMRFASASDVAHWEELSFFFTLFAARQKITLSYPKVIDNAELVPGAFFEQLGIDGEGPSVVRTAESVSSVEELRNIMLRQQVLAFDSVLDSARRNHRVELAREINPYYDEFDGVIGVPIDPAKRTWSASQITTIGQCSFRWFARRLLRLKAIEEMETGLDPATRGRLYHKALEIAVSRAIDAPDIRAETLDQLGDAFAEAELDENVSLPVLQNWDVERREQISELRKAVRSTDFILPEARVLAVEQEFKAQWEGFSLQGSIDRIDDTPGGLIAIDYKTSGQTPKGAKDETGKLSVDVQIPIYARIALPKLFPDKEFGTSLYYSLTKGKVLRTEHEGDMERLGTLAVTLRSILHEGSFAVDPDPQEKACTYCEFETVCRKGPRLRRKSRIR